MLKGKTIIELTDVNTGKKEVHEDHNMVTGALESIFAPIGHYKSQNFLFNSLYPYYTKMLGGLLLFDSEIPEETSQMYAPSSANLTACAVYGVTNSTSGTMRGNYNVTESVYSAADKSMKFVYDFATNQGNGTIASVCLTSNPAGYGSYGGVNQSIQSYTGADMSYMLSETDFALGGQPYDIVTPGATELLFAISKERDIAYSLRINSNTSLSIIERRAFIKSVSVFDTPTSTKPFVCSHDITLNTGLMGYTYFSCNYNREENKLYIISAGGNYVGNGGTFRVTIINCENWTATEHTVTNRTGENVSIGEKNSTQYGSGYGNHRCAYGHKGYIYLRNSSSEYYCTAIYKVSIEDSSTIKLDDHGHAAHYGSFTCDIEDRIYLYYYYNSYGNVSGATSIINTEKNDILKPEVRFIRQDYYRTWVPVMDDPILFFSGLNFRILNNYLATINNLSRPITKTSDKTMKVTYIIQEQQ